MDVFNQTARSPTSSTIASIPFDSLAKRYIIDLARQPLIQPTPTYSSTSTGHTTYCSNDAGLSFESEESYESVYGAIEDSGQEAACPEGHTFQHREFTLLNGPSDTAGPEHSIEMYTWVSEGTASTCAQEAGATWLGHADTTLGSPQGAEETPTASTTARTDPATTAKPLRAAPRSSPTRRKKNKGENKGEESAVIELPVLKKSVAAIWVLLIWFEFA